MDLAARYARVLALPFRYHIVGSLAIVLVATLAIAVQITDRHGFANGDLHRDVMDRWGAAIVQPAPSVRAVASGTVFNQLDPLALESQDVAVEAEMSYRRRGLVSFSGFEFGLRGRYRVQNRAAHDLDIAFVFPINLERNKVLLSDLRFEVDGKPAAIDLGPDGDRLVWTGRLARGAERAFVIAYRGRGLDSFTYRLDPALPVRSFRLAMSVRGGEEHDYPDGVVSASSVTRSADGVALLWEFRSLESGVPVGVTVPSEKSFDRILATMAARAALPAAAFFAGIAALGVYHGRRLRAIESYLVAAVYGVFYVLLAYLSAYIHFYLAFGVCVVALGGLLVAYLRRVIAPAASPVVVALLTACLVVPGLAVVLEGHTGLIYSLEILATLGALMALSTGQVFRTLAERAALLVVLACAASAGPAAAQTGAAGSPDKPAPVTAERERASATVPLAELLRLYQQVERSRPAPAPPPVGATLDRLELDVRLLDDVADVNAAFAVTVLEARDWVTLPLLEVGPATSIAELPTLDGAVLVRRSEGLVLMTNRAGVYRFELKLLERAASEGRSRRAVLRAPGATLAVLRLRVDEDLFRVVGPGGARAADGAVLYPEAGAFRLAWDRLGAERPERDVASRRPAIEPAIARARASLVATLEGRRIWRLRYELSFTGARPLVVELPAAVVATAVYLNGSSVPFQAPDGRLELEVTAARAGDEGGTLEVVAVEEGAGWSLAGVLRFDLPRVSWPVSELTVDLRLPAVYNYAWKGGSLAPVEAVTPVEFSHRIPEPGKPLWFQQHLITSSAPAVEVSYEIDLAGSYFR